MRTLDMISWSIHFRCIKPIQLYSHAKQAYVQTLTTVTLSTVKIKDVWPVLLKTYLSPHAVIRVGVSLVSKGKTLFVMHLVIVSESCGVWVGFLMAVEGDMKKQSTKHSKIQKLVKYDKFQVSVCERQCVTLAATRIHRLPLYSNRAFLKLHHRRTWNFT